MSKPIRVVLRKSTETSTLVVYASKGKKSGTPSTAKLGPGIQKLLEVAHKDGAFHGDKKEALFFRHCKADGHENVLFIGLGEKPTAECFRVAAAVTLAALKAHKVTSAGVLGDSIIKQVKDGAHALQALAEGFMLSVYEFNEMKTKRASDAKKAELEEISVLFAGAPSAAYGKAVERATVLAECQNFARRLGDLPSSHLTPTHLAEETIKAAKGTKLKVTVWDEARIKKERFGGLMFVAQGSDEPPRFIIMEYNGAPKSKKPVCFVGKGLTFDSGGISIKPSQSMEEMKYDMCGGATVIGTMLALAKLNAKVNAIAYVPATENMPGGSAAKPGDIYYARNGKTVEVFNTDAEGRLILGDALAYACEQKPAVILDAATLTGAILVSLGNTHTGVFSRDEKLLKKLQAASDTTGELIWPMPLTDFHRDDMKGIHADLCNISSGRLAGSSTAAAFLEEFISDGIPWAHFDIAGTAWNQHGRYLYCPRKGASGVMVRTFVEFAENY